MLTKHNMIGKADTQGMADLLQKLQTRFGAPRGVGEIMAAYSPQDGQMQDALRQAMQGASQAGGMQQQPMPSMPPGMMNYPMQNMPGMQPNKGPAMPPKEALGKEPPGAGMQDKIAQLLAKGPMSFDEGNQKPMIPKSGGMTRVSPGMYRDSKGSLVRK